MHVEIISTGNEVLHGEVTDTNSAWLASRLIETGYRPIKQITVGDDFNHLTDLFVDCSRSSDVVLVTGGLGPTQDDLTAAAAAQASGTELEVYREWVHILEERYRQRKMPLSNLKQARLPRGSEILPNPKGTACGFSLQIGSARFFFMPGVPYEMKHMFDEEVLPRMLQSFVPTEQKMTKRVFTFGLSESKVGELVSAHKNDGCSIGFRASFPLIEVKLYGTKQKIDPVLNAIRCTLKGYIFCEDVGDAASVIQESMVKRKWTLVLAESCTGGLLADQLVSVPGSSQYFMGSFVTYSNLLKTRLLHVSERVLESNGAVSLRVAACMASEARNKASADIALSVSGIAGPGGGTDEKPVGTVAFALAARERTYSQVLQFPAWGRSRIRKGSAMICLDMLRRYIEEIQIFPDYDYAKRIVAKVQTVQDAPGAS
ncbi:MAG: damage-inducible protein CinA [Acidobacteria bacterium]|nr:MAG: damage-inducible protein CinA [Acidobacteriota bacterium]